MATYFYKARITKVPVGSAVEYREPAIQGNLKLTVTDASTRGEYKLFVVEANDDQHKANVAVPDVEELAAEDAQKLAPKYQPQSTITQFNPFTQNEEKVEIPAADLGAFLEKRQ